MNWQSHGRHPVVAVAIAGGLLAIVGILWLVARNAPSSGIGDINYVPRTQISSSQGCANFARYWLDETSVDIDGAILEGFTNCRQGTDGKWYVLSALPPELTPIGSTIPTEREAAANEMKARILADIAILQQSFTDPMMDELGRVYSSAANPVIGYVREGASLSSVRTRYARTINGLMLDPRREALAGYVSWLMQQRIDAYGIFRRACLSDDTLYLKQPCTGMEDNLSIRYAPWYWELVSDTWLDTYLLHLYGEPVDTSES